MKAIKLLAIGILAAMAAATLALGPVERIDSEAQAATTTTNLPQFLHPVAWTYSGQWYDKLGFRADALKRDLRDTLIQLGATPVPGETWRVSGGTARAVMIDVEFEPADRPDLSASVNSPDGLLRIPYNSILDAVAEVTDLPPGIFDYGAFNGDSPAPFQKSLLQLKDQGVNQRLRLYGISAYFTGDSVVDQARWDRCQQMVSFLERIKARSSDHVYLIYWNRCLGSGVDSGRLRSEGEISADVARGMAITKYRMIWWCDWQMQKLATVALRSKCTGIIVNADEQAAQNALEAEGGWVNVYLRGYNYDRFVETIRKGN